MHPLEFAAWRVARGLLWLDVLLWSTAHRPVLAAALVVAGGAGELAEWARYERLEWEYALELEQHRTRNS